MIIVYRFTPGQHPAQADGLRKRSSLPAGRASVAGHLASTIPTLRNLTTALPASTHAGAICNLNPNSMEETHEIS